MEIDEPLQKEWIVRTEQNASAYTSLMTTNRSFSCTKSVASRTNAFLEQLSTQKAMKLLNSQASAEKLKTVKKELDQNRNYFAAQQRNKSLTDVKKMRNSSTNAIRTQEKSPVQPREYDMQLYGLEQNTRSQERVNGKNDDDEDIVVMLPDDTVQRGRGRRPRQPSQKIEKFSTVE